jgi:hypothetical protein
LTQDRLFHQQFTRANRLVVIGEDPYPIEVKNEDRYIWTDLETYLEEADVIIVQQVLKSIGETRQITAISDYINVLNFVLLVHHYDMAGPGLPLTMESPRRERATLDIKATITKDKDVIKNILSARALSGFDTVALYFGIGKGSIIRTLKDCHDFSAIENPAAPFEEVT